MNLKQLEAFVQVAEGGSFSKAAKQLFLTQPTISAHISSLEKELNARFFVRNTKEEQNSSYEHHENDNIAVDSTNVVSSPLVGIFYSAASPDEKDFVSVGDTVKKGQVLGIVEAMKLMNEIESEYDGVVKEILVDNEQMVEYGQPMFVIE